MRYLTWIPLLMLTACVSPEQQAAIRQQQLESDMQQCAEYGLEPGTEGFAECRKDLDMARRYPPVYYDPYPHTYLGVGYSRHRWR